MRYKSHHFLLAAAAAVADAQQGTSAFRPNIVGGSDAVPGQFPYFAAGYDCGASLIWKDIALTAAHCIGAFGDLLIGTTTRGEVDQFSESIAVIEEIQHPEYYESYNLSDKDYMILVLENEITNPVVNMVGLAGNTTNLAIGEHLTVMGYGSTQVERRMNMRNKEESSTRNIREERYGYDDYYDDDYYPSQLKFVEVPYIDRDECVRLYEEQGPEPFVVVPEFMICAADTTNGGVDSCGGDSGGPLVKNDEDIQVGIVSWGNGCGRPEAPGVYMDVSAEIEWIKAQVCKHARNPPDWACSGGKSPVPAPPRTTFAPTVSPAPTESLAPSPSPTMKPTRQPTKPPTLFPTLFPTTTRQPTMAPTTFELPEGFVKVEITVAHDQYPTETSWTLSSKETGNPLLSQDFGEVSSQYTIIYRPIAVIPGEYIFTINDAYGDGIGEPGYVEIKVNDRVILLQQKYAFGYEDEIVFTADTPAPSMAPTPFTIPEGFSKVEISIGHDAYPRETAWNLTSGADTVLSQSFDEVSTSFAVISKVLALEPGYYTFSIQDSLGDGIFSPPGFLEIKVNDEVVVSEENFVFETSQSYRFLVGGVSYFLLVQYDDTPSETFVQLRSMDTDEELATIPAGSTTTPRSFLSKKVDFLPGETLALVVIDSKGDGMNGGYVAIDSCSGDEDETLLFIAGNSFKEGAVETFSKADYFTYPTENHQLGNDSTSTKGRMKKKNRRHMENRRKLSGYSSWSKDSMKPSNICEGGFVEPGAASKKGKKSKRGDQKHGHAAMTKMFMKTKHSLKGMKEEMIPAKSARGTMRKHFNGLN